MKKLISLFLFIILMIVSGCQQNNQQADEGPDENDNRQIRVQDVQENERKNLNAQQIARRLVEIAEKEPGVKDAVAVVAGDYAVVGIDVDKDLDRSRVGTIKYSVAEAMKDDPYGKRVIVTADADTMERLREIGRKLEEGHPVQGVLEELAKIVGRLIPQTPDDFMNLDEPTRKNQSEQPMQKQERQQLDRQQKKQVPNEPAPRKP